MEPVSNFVFPLESKLFQASLLAHDRGHLQPAILPGKSANTVPTFGPSAGPESGLGPVRAFAAGASVVPALEPKEPLTVANFDMNVEDLMSLLDRVDGGQMTLSDLQSMSVTDLTLSYAEREVLRYLQRNPQVFQAFAGLDDDGQSLSALDVQKATRMAGNALVLTPDQIVAAAEQHQLELDAMPGHGVFSRQHAAAEIQAILDKIKAERHQANPFIDIHEPLTVGELHAYQPASGSERSQWTDQERRQLSVLQSPAMMQYLDNLARLQQGNLTPEVIRVMVSLLWNPMIYAATLTPLMVFSPEETDVIEPEVTHLVPPVYFRQANPYHQPWTPTGYRSIKFSAEELQELCTHLNLQNGISLKELKAYQPQNEKEARLLQYLNQMPIFHALAELDGDEETLNAEDIRLALNEHSLVLADQHLIIAITP